MTKTIVGVDGSPAAAKAFAWALAHARPDDTVVAFHTWQIPPVVGLDAGYYQPGNLREQAETFVEEFVADAVADIHLDVDGPEVATLVANGHVGQELVAASDATDVIVVGSRGLGGFRGLLLGSTSNYVLHHARCPVVVVRADSEYASSDPESVGADSP